MLLFACCYPLIMNNFINATDIHMKKSPPPSELEKAVINQLKVLLPLCKYSGVGLV